MADIMVKFLNIPEGDYCSDPSDYTIDCPHAGADYFTLGCSVFPEALCASDERGKICKCDPCKRSLKGEILDSKSA